MLKKIVLVAMTIALTDAASAANNVRPVERPKEREAKTTQPHAQGQIGAANARGAREAYVNSLYGKLQDRALAQKIQELYLKPELVENDPAAIKGVEKFIGLVRKHEVAGKTADQAVDLALRELRPDLKLTSKDLVECK